MPAFWVGKSRVTDVLVFSYTVVHKCFFADRELQPYRAVILTCMFSLSCHAIDVSASEMCQNENAN